MARKKPIIEQTIIELHQHDLGNFLICPQKYYLSVVRNYHPLILKKALNIGDLFARCVYFMHKGTPLSECLTYVHSMQDEHLKLVTSAEQSEDLETNVVVVQAMLQGYKSHFLKNNILDITKYNESGGITGFDKLEIKQIIPEYKITISTDVGSYTFKYINRLDGKIITTGLPWILEIKSTSQFDGDLIHKLNTNFQVNSYWLSLAQSENTEVGGILYRYVKKPSIKQKQKETIDQYRKRLMLDYLERPENYFLEESLCFNQPALDAFKKDMKIYLDRLLMAHVTGVFERHGLSCDGNFGLCEYLKYCKNPTEETLNTFFRKGE